MRLCTILPSPIAQLTGVYQSKHVNITKYSCGRRETRGHIEEKGGKEERGMTHERHGNKKVLKGWGVLREKGREGEEGHFERRQGREKRSILREGKGRRRTY